MNRRTFLQSSIAAALADRPAWPTVLSRKIDLIGLQLYTVRDSLEKD